jgi:hypothetical protein
LLPFDFPLDANIGLYPMRDNLRDAMAAMRRMQVSTGGDHNFACQNRQKSA